jgi:hypothetical protein
MVQDPVLAQLFHLRPYIELTACYYCRGPLFFLIHLKLHETGNMIHHVLLASDLGAHTYCTTFQKLRWYDTYTS